MEHTQVMACLDRLDIKTAWRAFAVKMTEDGWGGGGGRISAQVFFAMNELGLSALRVPLTPVKCGQLTTLAIRLMNCWLSFRRAPKMGICLPIDSVDSVLVH